MTVQSRASTETVSCISCKTDNASQAKFCKACGHTLYEPCQSCSEPVLLTQNFCVACGTDLEAALRERHDTHRQWLAEAIAAAKQSNFDRSLSLLRRLAGLTDKRFHEAADHAKKAIEKVERLKAQTESTTTDAIQRADQAYVEERFTDVVAILQSVPENLLGEQARKRLTHAKSFQNEIQTLETEMRSAVEKRDWVLAGGLIGQLIDAMPAKTDYQTIGQKIVKKLVVSAEKYVSVMNYPKAVARLAAIPPTLVGPADATLRDRIGNAEWLSAQVDAEPWATPMLGRLAVRFSTDFPEDQTAKMMVKELSQALKQSPRPPRMHVPFWKGDRQAIAGGEVCWLGVPKSVDVSNQPLMRSHAGKFSVALGIATQALGRGRVKEFFSPKKKSSMLGGFGRKKKSSVWAFDVGTSSVKAVCVEDRDGTLVVTDCAYAEYETPLCRSGQGDNPAKILGPVIEKIKAEKSLEDAKIYANLTASRTVTRFVRLPPVSDKKSNELLKLEIEQRIPIAADDLAMVQTLTPLDEESDHGRAAVVTAMKRYDLESRFSLLASVGLEVDGVQVDTLAIANLASIEFADLWTPPESDDDAGGRKAKKKKAAPEFDNTRDETPAVMIVDAGASSTKVVIISGETHWMWTVESGGEDLNVALARTAKVTHAEAEPLKRDPASLRSPAAMFASVEQRQEELRVRLERIVADAQTQNSRFDIQQVWCVGGGVMTLGWARRTLVAAKP